MPECDENIVNIDVFIRLHFSTFFMTLACKWSLGTSFWGVLRDLGCLIGLLATLYCGLLKSMISREEQESTIPPPQMEGD